MELKPCPFCGGKPREHDDYVECCMTLDMTAEEWNDRPIEDELRERIKELEDDKFILEDLVRIYEQKLFEEDDQNL